MVKIASWQTAVLKVKSKDVPIPYISNSDNPDVLVLPGLGEERRTAESLIKHLGSIAVAVLPFKYNEEAIIDSIVREGPLVVIKSINESAGKCSNDSMHLVGHSQGGGIAISSAATEPKLIRNIGTVAPAGLTNELLGGDQDTRRKTFFKRLFINAFLREDQAFWHPGNFVAGWEVGKRLASDMLPRLNQLKSVNLLDAKLNYALSQNMLAYVAELNIDHNIRIFAGDKDPIFTVAEYVRSLGSIGLENDVLEVVPGSHASGISPRGRNQVARAIDWVRLTPVK